MYSDAGYVVSGVCHIPFLLYTMKSVKKIAKIIGLVGLSVVVAAFLYLYFSGPSLPPGTEAIIDRVLESPLPEPVGGDTGHARSGNVSIWYESLSPEGPPKGTVLLVMGISNDALGWPRRFIDPFVDEGYRVIRYDHRGTGLSDWMTGWDSHHPYSLADMADDALAVMDACHVQQAHVVGISMGGMIAQELAIRHPGRTASLTSVMSSGDIEDPDLPPISSDVVWKLIRVSLKYGLIGGERNLIRLHLASRLVLMGDARYEPDVREIAETVLYNLRRRKGFNPDASRQHQAAVSLSGPRYAKLAELQVPTFIVHGQSDPFIPVAHGKKCASIIPNADSLWVEGMGHDIPDALAEKLAREILVRMER